MHNLQEMHAMVNLILEYYAFDGSFNVLDHKIYLQIIVYFSALYCSMDL